MAKEMIYMRAIFQVMAVVLTVNLYDALALVHNLGMC